jgi:hypothetical protein
MSFVAVIVTSALLLVCLTSEQILLCGHTGIFHHGLLLLVLGIAIRFYTLDHQPNSLKAYLIVFARLMRRKELGQYSNRYFYIFLGVCSKNGCSEPISATKRMASSVRSTSSESNATISGTAIGASPGYACRGDVPATETLSRVRAMRSPAKTSNIGKSFATIVPAIPAQLD